MSARNVTRDAALATSLEVASSFWAKFMGLMGRPTMPDGAGLWRYWAFGTYRHNGCYFTPDGSCGMQMVWHVGGPKGFNTRSVPNGSYKYCVEALTIAGVDARRCTAVKIAN